MLKRLNAGAAVQAACAMELWRKADFEGERIVVDALVRRRAAEKALFLTPPNGAWAPAPSPLLRPVIDLDALDLVPLRRPVEVETSFDGRPGHGAPGGPVPTTGRAGARARARRRRSPPRPKPSPPGSDDLRRPGAEPEPERRAAKPEIAAVRRSGPAPAGGLAEPIERVRRPTSRRRADARAGAEPGREPEPEPSVRRAADLGRAGRRRRAGDPAAPRPTIVRRRPEPVRMADLEAAPSEFIPARTRPAAAAKAGLGGLGPRCWRCWAWPSSASASSGA